MAATAGPADRADGTRAPPRMSWRGCWATASVAARSGSRWWSRTCQGASGIVAHQAVARAAPDGYTLLFTNTSGMAINPVSFKQLPYDPARDFAPVAMVCGLGPQMLSVNAQVPVQTPAEFVAYAKANRGKLSVAFDTTAGAAAFAAKLLNRRGRPRPDRSAVPIGRADDAGRRQRGEPGDDQLGRRRQRGRAGRQGAAHRDHVGTSAFPGLPDLPALSETVPGMVMNGWFAVVAPTGTPAAVVARLNHEIGEYLKGPEIQKRLLSFGLATEGAGTPESTGQSIKLQQERWRELAKELAITPQ